ncbi:MAG TPA: PHP domain-containing protein [Chitinophagaceae bacterium]|nr:PHP domain-containing protein [Chitinophagaceae bacterium]
MDNYAIADNLSLLAKLMDIHGENSFKSRSYAAAAFQIEKLPVPLRDTPRDELPRIRGIGESVARKITEMLDTGELQLLKEYLVKTPAGVAEMLNIKGLGPKKIHTIWKEMELESVGELLYACEENRLTLFRGFGEKTQQNVREAIEFYLQHQGSFLYAQVHEVFPQVQSYLEKLFGREKVRVTGAYRRQALTIGEIEFVVAEPNDVIKPKFLSAHPPELLAEDKDNLLYRLKNGLKLLLHTGSGNISTRQFQTTGGREFISDFQERFPAGFPDIEVRDDDSAVFDAAGISFVPPCLRDLTGILDRAQRDELPQLIRPSDIKGIIHSHSNWSDGVNSIEEMAKECIRRGYEYLVISDHSKTAAYANGLSEERVREQHRYIDQLNSELKPFRIFKSIESDILNDGSLDYPDEMLAAFDMVIASVHSNLRMPEEKAMARLLKAIDNRHTTILGHMTGRLLLTRNGYPVDHRRIIDACAQQNVVIEINAHPRRLDMDWSWIGYAMERGVLLSIDPDAHELAGFDDVQYGVFAAQKGGLTSAFNVSSFTLAELEAFLENQKRKS